MVIKLRCNSSHPRLWPSSSLPPCWAAHHQRIFALHAYHCRLVNHGHVGVVGFHRFHDIARQIVVLQRQIYFDITFSLSFFRRPRRLWRRVCRFLLPQRSSRLLPHRPARLRPLRHKPRPLAGCHFSSQPASKARLASLSAAAALNTLVAPGGNVFQAVVHKFGEHGHIARTLSGQHLLEAGVENLADVAVCQQSLHP